jgi:serine protease Do
MRKIIANIVGLAFVTGLLVPASVLAQKEEKDKEVKEKKEVRQFVITSKGDKDEKVVIEIKGDKVTVNGKPIEEFNDEDLKVKMHKLKDLESLTFERMPGTGVWNFDTKGDKDGKGYRFFSQDENMAMLGVTTQKNADGAEVQSITKESGAEKAGLKENDIITKINDTKITEPDDLSAAIKKQKPGDKVTVTFLRDKKEQKVTAELTKWKGVNAWKMEGDNFNMNFDNLHMDKIMPKIESLKGLRTPYGQNWMWSGGSPKLGLSVQDTDDGKGVKVIEVDEESNAAKAGIKKDDVITEVDGKTMNSTDDIVKVINENKEKNSISVKLSRGGKSQTIEVKMPRKIKKADL